jgi:hypothetical protein
MRSRPATRKAGAVLPLTLLLLSTLFGSRAEAAGTRELFAGDGYGSYTFAGQTAMSGKSAFVVLGCRAAPGTVVQNSAQSSDQAPPDSPAPAPTPAPAPSDPGTTQTGSVSTSVAAIQQSGVTKTLTTAKTNAVNMLKGRITASRAKAVSSTFRDGSGYHTSAAGSTLSDLVVDGKAFEVQPGPNTIVTLPDLGRAVFNEQFSTTSGSLPFMVVNMIHVYVTQPNALQIPVGTEMIVSRAYSALKTNIPGVLAGFAYGTKVGSSPSAQSSPSAIVYMPCLGTNGGVITNQTGTVGQLGVFSVGSTLDTAQGTVGSRDASGRLTSSVQAVDLLGGLVTADAVEAVAHTVKSGGAFAFDDQGSKILNLMVAGVPVSSAVAPNTRIDLPGIGTLWLHRVIRTPTSLDVRMIEIDVDQANAFGLEPGSVLQVAEALVIGAA